MKKRNFNVRNTTYNYVTVRNIYYRLYLIETVQSATLQIVLHWYVAGDVDVVASNYTSKQITVKTCFKNTHARARLYP